MLRYLIFLTVLAAVSVSEPAAETKSEDVDNAQPENEEPPEGYYAFVESPNATPPRVRPPPYRQVAMECAGAGQARAHVSAANLCGDLNRGLIPRNPMGHAPQGEPYPFELIRNHTLRFLSRTLPVLRADDALPRVAHLAHTHAAPHANPYADHNRLEEHEGREKRSVSGAEPEPSAPRAEPHAELRVEHRAAPATDSFCAGGGVLGVPLSRTVAPRERPTEPTDSATGPNTSPSLPPSPNHLQSPLIPPPTT